MTIRIDSPGSKPRIAVVEDDLALLENTVEYLQAVGYPAWGCSSAEGFYKRLVIDPVDVVVLDVGLPGEDGVSVARYLADQRQLAVIIVSARSTLDDRLIGLRSGADRYLVKPVDFVELIANIEAVSRRQISPMKTLPRKVQAATIWRLTGQDWRLAEPGGNSIMLTSREFAVMRLLFEAQNQTVLRKTLTSTVFGPNVRTGSERLDVVLARLRKKSIELLGMELPIKNVHQVGYIFTAPSVLE